VATGWGPAGQSLVTGPVVNAAARLQTAADPGQVLVGETTYALTRAAVSFRARRDVRAKGFDRPLAAFPVEALTARSTRRTIPFVGRAAELALLRGGLSRATGTGQPVLVTVLGEPGIGKSRLADEFTAGVGGDAIVLAGHTRSYTDTATFAPAAGVVGELAGFREDDQHAASSAKLRALVERACDPGVVEPVLDRLSLLFGMTHGRTESAFVSDVQAGFLALIDGVAKDRPVVLVFEDAHTLKGPMLDLIERLGAHTRTGRRAVILVLARSELQQQRPVWGTTALDPVMVRLGLLTSGESIDLVRQAGGAGIDEAAASEIAARAGGNPFFIIETTGMFMPDGSGPSSSPAVIPPTVQAVISARIDALPERLRELARRASAFLVSFDLDELAVADPSATVEDLRLLEDAEIVVREEGGPGPSRWRLRHATLRDVAYASLPKRERVRLHRSIAERLATTGHHSWASDHLELAAFASLDLDPTDRAVSDEAADALVASGDRARRRMESRSAIDYYERALAVADPPAR
jgi:predicted ATPase